MATFIILPGGVVNSYRKRSINGFYEVAPTKLYQRNAYAIPALVLDNPDYAPLLATLSPPLTSFALEELTAEDFEWWHEQDDE